MALAISTRTYFNPRAPYGARLYSRRRSITIDRFQSTRPIRGATAVTTGLSWASRISIHAPHTGRDSLCESKRLDQQDFNPRAPYGARLLRPILSHGINIFQSTRPIRGATNHIQSAELGIRISIHAPHTGRDSSNNELQLIQQDFNPRAPYGARLSCFDLLFDFINKDFNPRAPYGARQQSSTNQNIDIPFQSTRPIRGATLETK